MVEVLNAYRKAIEIILNEEVGKILVVRGVSFNT